MKNILMAALLFVSVSALADFQKGNITNVTNEKGESVLVSSLSTDGALAGMELTAPDYKKTFLAADIAKGVVLVEQDKYKVLLLKGAVDARTQEGDFTMSYLFNAPSNTYKTCQFTLRRDGNGWFIENSYTRAKPVTNIKVIRGSFGVDTLQGICPAK
jgi:hypothetical protein